MCNKELAGQLPARIARISITNLSVCRKRAGRPTAGKNLKNPSEGVECGGHVDEKAMPASHVIGQFCASQRLPPELRWYHGKPGSTRRFHGQSQLIPYLVALSASFFSTRLDWQNDRAQISRNLARVPD